MLDNNVNYSLIGWLHHARKTVAGIASVVTLTFLSLVLSPTMVAARQMWDEGLPRSAQTQAPGVDAQFAKTVIQLKRQLERMAERLERDAGPPDWVVFKQLRRDLEQLHGKVQDRFDRLEDHIERKGLPTAILTRHLDAVDQYEAEFGQLSEELSSIADAADDTALKEAVDQALSHLESVQLETSHQPFDPSHLPFGTPEERAGRPGETGKALQARVVGKAIDTVGKTTISKNKATPTEQDLAETEDVRLTPQIEAKAAELGHDPVAIYNWVRNNVEFVASYGAIQGADQTLALQRGNAFDTASLLIALLRASDIPARYAYGTVTMPADRTMNWVGGVDVPEAAMNLMGQGGIPNRGLSQDGVITHIRFEHVWVEAWVDFEPSRGAVHVQGDTWVSLDGSFKQYDYQAGMGIAESVPFDAQDFADQLQSAATVNEQEGWVQDVDQALIENELAAYQQQVENYINSQDPEATVGEVLGGRTIIAQTLPELPSGLPYELEARTDAFAELPDRLRWHFRYQLQNRFGGAVFTFQESLPALAGSKLALSFKPATAEDQQVVESYLPEPGADGSIGPADLPDSLPGYLIHVVPEWTVDGEVMASGGEFALGEELRRETALKPPAAAWQPRTKYLVAGEYQAIGLNGQGLPASDLSQLQAELERVKYQLETEEFAGLTKHDLTGNLLQTGILSWFALNDVQNQIAAAAAGVVTERLPSFGAFQLDLETTYSFGIPKEVRFPGVLMDVGWSKLQIVAKDNSEEKFIGFNRSAGARGSANEHAVPEQLFSTPETPAEGVSAVKAIAIAAAQGQRIYTITQDNLATALDALTLDTGTESDIRNAVNAGLQVTTHQHPISYAGFNGAGYILLDPETGSGAYKISGGADGGSIFDSIATFTGWIASILEGLSIFFEGYDLDFMGRVLSWLGTSIDLAKLLARCGTGDALTGLLASILVGAGVATMIFTVFAWIPILLLSVAAVTILAIMSAIIGGIVSGAFIDGFAEDCG